jgi:hypothetical protein
VALLLRGTSPSIPAFLFATILASTLGAIVGTWPPSRGSRA